MTDLQRASSGNQALQQALVELYARTDSLQNTATPTSGIPPVCQFTVQGVDGSFVIDITNPQVATYQSIKVRTLANGTAQYATVPTNATVTHQLQTSTSLYFDDAGDVRSYGPDTKVHWEMTDTPNQNRYIRLRSSYDGGTTWNRWSIYSDPQTCGVIPIWSGQIRAIRQMPNAQTNCTNFAYVDSQVAGDYATIRVYGAGGVGTPWYRNVGGSHDGPYPAATLTNQPQGMVLDVYYNISTQAYVVIDPSTNFPYSLMDHLVFAGELTTATGTSTGTTGGGGSAGGGGGQRYGCVEEGTPVEFCAGAEVEEKLLPCDEWVVLEFAGEESISMHPETLVSTFKRAIDLAPGDKIEVGQYGEWRIDFQTRYERRNGVKVSRRVKPHGTYFAGSAKVRVHNMKPSSL